MQNGTVVFDLDGTLADTSGDLLAAANACFRDMGHGDVLSLPEDYDVALRGGRAMLTRGLTKLGKMDPSVVDAWYRPLLVAYAAEISTHTQIYPGAMAALETLKTRGYAVAVCTNKPEALARQLLSNLGVLDAFGALVGADTLPVRKPNPDPFWAAVDAAGGARPACLVGDTDTDRMTSRNANVASILVTFGPNGHAMPALQPDALLDHFDDLPDVVDQLLSR